MSKVKQAAFMFVVSALGMLFALGLWRAYSDYQDFLRMRVWVAQMQQLQADAAKQQGQARVVQQPAPEEVKK